MAPERITAIAAAASSAASVKAEMRRTAVARDVAEASKMVEAQVSKTKLPDDAKEEMQRLKEQLALDRARARVETEARNIIRKDRQRRQTAHTVAKRRSHMRTSIRRHEENKDALQRVVSYRSFYKVMDNAIAYQLRRTVEIMEQAESVKAAISQLEAAGKPVPKELKTKHAQAMRSVAPDKCRAWAAIFVLERMSRVDLDCVMVQLDRLIKVTWALAKTDTSRRSSSLQTQAGLPAKREKPRVWAAARTGAELEEIEARRRLRRKRHGLGMTNAQMHAHARLNDVAEGSYMGMPVVYKWGQYLMRSEVEKGTYKPPLVSLVPSSSHFSSSAVARSSVRGIVSVRMDFEEKIQEGHEIKASGAKPVSVELPAECGSPTESGDTLVMCIRILARVAHR